MGASLGALGSPCLQKGAFWGRVLSRAPRVGCSRCGLATVMSLPVFLGPRQPTHCICRSWTLKGQPYFPSPQL